VLPPTRRRHLRRRTRARIGAPRRLTPRPSEFPPTALAEVLYDAVARPDGCYLGGGAWGKVYLGKVKATGRNVALKIVDPANYFYAELRHGQWVRTPYDMGNAHDYAKIVEEFVVHDLLSKLGDPHILRMLSAHEVLPANPQPFAPAKRGAWFVVALHFAEGGSVHESIARHAQRGAREAYTEARARAAFADVAHGLARVHEAGVVHRDLKLENLLQDNHTGGGAAGGVGGAGAEPAAAAAAAPHALLCDFGLARRLDGPETRPGVVGSKHTWAPKLWAAWEADPDASPAWAFADDVWALGCILFSMVAGHSPWTHEGESAAWEWERVAFPRDTIKRRSMANPPDIGWSRRAAVWAQLPQLRDLVERMLRPAEADRLTMAGVLAHPWLRAPAPARVALDGTPEALQPAVDAAARKRRARVALGQATPSPFLRAGATPRPLPGASPMSPLDMPVAAAAVAAFAAAVRAGGGGGGAAGAAAPAPAPLGLAGLRAVLAALGWDEAALGDAPAERLFRALDADGDGYVRPADLAPLAPLLRGARPPLAELVRDAAVLPLFWLAHARADGAAGDEEVAQLVRALTLARADTGAPAAAAAVRRALAAAGGAGGAGVGFPAFLEALLAEAPGEEEGAMDERS